MWFGSSCPLFDKMRLSSSLGIDTMCNIYIYTWGLLTDLSDLFLAQDHDRTVNRVRQSSQSVLPKLGTLGCWVLLISPDSFRRPCYAELCWWLGAMNYWVNPISVLNLLMAGWQEWLGGTHISFKVACWVQWMIGWIMMDLFTKHPLYMSFWLEPSCHCTCTFHW